jgi:epoxyqueuosine reductase
MTYRKTGLDAELYKSNPCRFLENAIKKYVATSPLNTLTTFDNAPIYDEPVVVFADGDDPIFKEYKTIIGDFHLTPREAMDKYVKAKAWRYGLNTALVNISVISWALPITNETRLSECNSKYGGSRRYNNTRWFGGPFGYTLQDYIVQLLEILGNNAVAPTRAKFAKTIKTDKGLMANWSERHIAFAAGMGTFGLNGLMISPKGCAVYLGSVVCDAAFTPTPRIYQSHMAYCLFSQDGSCQQCIKRCQGGAISEQGRNNNKCRDQITVQVETLKQMGMDEGLIGLAPACGLCSTGVPCEDRIPSAKVKRESVS